MSVLCGWPTIIAVHSPSKKYTTYNSSKLLLLLLWIWWFPPSHKTEPLRAQSCLLHTTVNARLALAQLYVVQHIEDADAIENPRDMHVHYMWQGSFSCSVVVFHVHGML